MNSVVSPSLKYSGTIIEYLDQGRLKAALVTREQERHLAVIDSAGHERLVPRDLVLMRHPERSADRENVAEALKELEHERAELAAELDLELLWQVAQEQSRSFSAVELADLFFGRKSNAAASVMLEALLNDRTYFVRRHMDFVPRTRNRLNGCGYRTIGFVRAATTIAKSRNTCATSLSAPRNRPPTKRPRLSKSCLAISKIRSRAAAT